MELELGGALSPTAVPGVSAESLERIDRHVASAHDRIQREIEAEAFGYRSLDLATRTDPTTITEAVDQLEPFDAIAVIGMGGSANGARAIAQSLAPSKACFVLDSTDPTYLDRIVNALPLDRTALHVVSKSGTTVETRAIFRYVRHAMDAEGVDWTERTIATTAADGPLGKRVERADVPRLDPPAGVPGRYSVLSSMALPSAAMLGVDIEGLLRGGKRGRDRLAPSLFDAPPYAYGAMMWALSTRGARQNAIVPYAEDLAGFGEWFRQLWAESLGKDGLGQTPVLNRGVADHHSQLQLWRSGPSNLVITTLTVDHSSSDPIGGDEYLSDVTLNELHDLERRAAEASIQIAGRPLIRLDTGPIDAETLGELFVMLEAACICYAELAGLDPFDQPAVEWGKQAVRDTLAGKETEYSQQLEKDSTLTVR